jgi:hypothetical protein
MIFGLIYLVSLILVRLFYFTTNHRHSDNLDVGDWCAILLPWVNTVFAFIILLCILIIGVTLVCSCICELWISIKSILTFRKGRILTK